MASEEKEQWICTALDVEGGIRPGSRIKPVMRGVAAKDLRWEQGTNLKVYFLQGTTNMHNQFMEIAKEWLPPGEVSLTLGQTTNINDSHIRVTFDPKSALGEYWSLIGTKSNNARGKSTLNVANVTRSMVLHEFGHALGFVHEQAHKDANIVWNKDQVYKDLYNANPEFWTKANVDAWVFEKFDSSKQIITEFDIESVMMYPRRTNWTKNYPPGEIPDMLSEGDKASIRKLYPPRA